MLGKNQIAPLSFHPPPAVKSFLHQRSSDQISALSVRDSIPSDALQTSALYELQIGLSSGYCRIFKQEGQ